MTTIIAVRESTRDKLKRLMRQEGTKNLDETIVSLMQKAEQVPRSMFGADKNMDVHL